MVACTSRSNSTARSRSRGSPPSRRSCTSRWREAAPITLTLGETGAFPTIRRARVLRLEIEAEPKLELLQDRIERGSEAIGYPPEGRPFLPHVTLGRVREGQRLPHDAAATLERIAVEQTFVADRVVLFESMLTPDGPVYHERVVQRLGAEAA